MGTTRDTYSKESEPAAALPLGFRLHLPNSQTTTGTVSSSYPRSAIVTTTSCGLLSLPAALLCTSAPVLCVASPSAAILSSQRGLHTPNLKAFVARRQCVVAATCDRPTSPLPGLGSWRAQCRVAT